MIVCSSTAKLSMLHGFTEGKCGCFLLINKWHSRVQSTLHAIRLYVQSGSDALARVKTRLLSEKLWFTVLQKALYPSQQNIKNWKIVPPLLLKLSAAIKIFPNYKSRLLLLLLLSCLRTFMHFFAATNQPTFELQ